MSATIASVSAIEGLGTKDLTVTAAAGAAVGDALVVFAFADNGTILTTATPGWTLQKEIGLADGVMAAFSTDTVAGDMIVTSRDFQDVSAVYLRITGGDYAGIVWGEGAEDNSDNIPVPSIIIPEADCLEIIGAGNDSSRAQTTPTGFTVAANNVGNNNISAFERISPAGVTGIRNVAIAATRRNAGLSIAVPAASTGSGIAADTGTFALSGQDASFITASMLDADTGAFAVSGQAVDFITPVAGAIDADTGSFTLSGQDAAFVTASVINADAGAFTVTGQDAEFVTPVAGVIDAATGAFSATGQDATFISASILSAGTGAFDTTGQPITLTVGSALMADTGAFAIAGGLATFVTQSILAADMGLFAISGKPVSIGGPEEVRVFPLKGQIRSNFTLSGQIRDTFEISGQIRPHFKIRT